MADVVMEEKAPAVEAKQIVEEKVEVAPKEETGDETNKPTEGDAIEKTQTENQSNKSDDAKGMLKTTRRHHNDRQKNMKFDPSKLEETDDPKQIRAQVEFYFGDANLPTDKFLWEQTGGPENKAVPLKTICAFKRMQRFKPYSAVVVALKESNMLELEGENGDETIKRKKAYSPESTNHRRRFARSVYVKGFGDETPDTQFKLEAFFQNLGPAEAVRLRRTEDKLFKGSVFVEFASEKAAQDFLNLDPKPTWEGHELLIMSKQAYCEGKEKLIKEGKIQPSSNPSAKFWEGKEGKKDRAGIDKNDWKKRRDADQKNGFRGGRGRDGGRGGRGRGRGGRGGNRDRHDRNNRRERKDENGGSGEKKDVDAAKASEETVKSEVAKEATSETVGSKRAREDGDGGDASEPPAKKVDTKTEVAAES